jgi:23S rRNA (uracil1939-C5)-methyltransferase
LQHLSPAHQLELKQSTLLESLQRIGAVRPAEILEPITGDVWRYRRKARLAVKFVIKKDRVLVGFRERNKPYVMDMLRCETLHPAIGERIDELIELIDGLSIRDRLPQVEAAVGDNAVAMVFRVLDSPTAQDVARFTAFQEACGVHVYLQSKGPDSISPLPDTPAPEDLFYTLPRFNVTLHFKPTDFVQVHAEVNRKMIDQAASLLDPGPNSRVLDLYCGLGNFSLPMATLAGEVVGLELDADMVARARQNARRSDIHNAVFQQANLTEPTESGLRDWRGFDVVILDPPRTGALEMLPILGEIGADRILYTSCHPGTLARDAKYLVHELRYDLVAAGVMDMFPHTSHVESMALFKKQ